MTTAERIETEMSTTLAGLLLIKQASEAANPPRKLAYLAGKHLASADLATLDKVDWSRAYEAGKIELAKW